MEKRIVLLHGWEARAGKLEPLAGELRKLGWKVKNLEMPGFGLPAPKTVWGVGEYADWVKEKVGGDCVVFGHSFGGRVAIKMAARGTVKRVVLCAPGGLSRPDGMKRMLFGALAKVGKTLGLEKYKAILYKLAREHDYEKTSGTMREVFKKVVDEDLNPLVGEINVPTLVLWGKQDRVVPYTDAQKFIQAKVVLIENQGHRLPYELPERVAREINIWMKSL